MKTMRLTIILIAIVAMYSCGPSDSKQEDGKTQKAEKAEKKDELPESIKEGKGIGDFTDMNLDENLDEELVKKGQEAFEMKCTACHKLGNERQVGPGLAGVTNRRKPEWIMNMITNPDEMLKKDPAAKALLKEYMTQMPDQNVPDEEARAILEFLRKNDMEQVGKRDQAAE